MKQGGFQAKLCVGRCKALRGRMQSFASEMGKTGTEILSPILDKSKWWKDSPDGYSSPQEISAELSKCRIKQKSVEPL